MNFINRHYSFKLKVCQNRCLCVNEVQKKYPPNTLEKNEKINTFYILSIQMKSFHPNETNFNVFIEMFPALKIHRGIIDIYYLYRKIMGNTKAVLSFYMHSCILYTRETLENNINEIKKYITVQHKQVNVAEGKGGHQS